MRVHERDEAKNDGTNEVGVGRRTDAVGMESRNNYTPILKKNRKTVENYRRVTLLITKYKVYEVILNERTKKEIETKKMLPDTKQIFEWKGISG